MGSIERKKDIWDLAILRHGLENEVKNNNRAFMVMVTVIIFRKFQIETSTTFYRKVIFILKNNR